MNILPIFAQDATRRHWIVRTLRYFGFFQVALVTLTGVGLAYNFGVPLLAEAFGLSYNVAGLVCVIVGGLLSFGVGMLSSIGLWGLAMVIDDLHALRIYASGYVADNLTGSNNEH